MANGKKRKKGENKKRKRQRKKGEQREKGKKGEKRWRKAIFIYKNGPTDPNKIGKK